MRAVILGLIATVVALVVMAKLKREPSAPPLADAEPLHALRVAEVPHEGEVPPAPASNEPAQPEEAELILQESRLLDPAFRKAVVKHMDLRYLKASPAKDTPEAKAIEAMLAQRGVGREAVPACYNLAYQRAMTIRRAEEAGHGEAGRFIAETQAARERDQIVERYGALDTGFWEEMLAIEPTVFFGQKDFQRPALGTRLLTE